MKLSITGLTGLAAFTLLVSSCATHKPTAGFLPTLPAGQKWQLVWQDEFNGTTLDTNKWEQLGDSKRRDGWWMKAGAFLDGQGNLVVRTDRQGGRYTSGAVQTRGRFEHAFGFWTARCQLPKQPGHWAAFWIMGDTVGRVGDEGRDGTEIDVAEFPYRDGSWEINLHWDGYGRAHKSVGRKLRDPEIMSGYHEFSLWWTPTEYVFYLDGREMWRTTASGISQHPEFAMFSNEVGTWAGDIRHAKLPDDFLVDYLRVYDVVPENQ